MYISTFVILSTVSYSLSIPHWANKPYSLFTSGSKRDNTIRIITSCHSPLLS
uniref:Secreted protein n=1 Tax=Heterorhabditis bacteriophora TaxID=37862 RepID=A0A1I7WA56_HETBA